MPLRFRILSAPQGGRPASTKGLDGDMTAGPREERTFEVDRDCVEVRLGRRPTSDIELPFPSVSAAHARLFKGDSAHDWWLEDEGSTNGTWLDGQRLSPRRPAAVRPGQRMRIATVDIVFEGWSASVRGDESTGTLARRLIADLFGAAEGEVPSLAVERGPAAPANIRLVERERRYVAGRADTCDLVLSGEHVSREHAAFVRRWDGVFVSDLGSRNGILVNGTVIAGEHRMSDGDRVQIGVVALRLADPEDRYLRRIEAAGESEGEGAGADPREGAFGLPAVVVDEAAGRRPGTPSAPATPIAAAPASEGASPAGRPPLRTLAMVLIAGIVIVAVVGFIVLLVG